MEKVMLCCTTCPTECVLTVMKEGNLAVSVEGNTCKRGIKFAEKELTTPERTLTSTMIVMLDNKELLIPVKTAQPIPKKNMLAAMDQIKTTVIHHVFKMGDVLIPNICESGVDIVACKSLKEDRHAC